MATKKKTTKKADVPKDVDGHIQKRMDAGRSSVILRTAKEYEKSGE